MSADSHRGMDVPETRTERLLRHAALHLAVLAALLAPWLFGGADSWAALFLCLLAYASLLCRLLGLMAADVPRLRHPALARLLLVVALVAGAQAVPLPASWVRVMSPASARMQTGALEVLRRVNAPARVAPELAPVVARETLTLSVAPGTTRRAGMILGACLAIFFVVTESVGSRHSARRVAVLLVASGFALALVSIIQQLSGTPALLWIKTPRDWTRAFGPFTNRNHAAMHFNLLLGLAVGLMLGAVRHEPGRSVWRSLSSHTANGVALAGIAVILLGGTVFTSLSRGGVVSLIGGLLALVVLLFTRGGLERRRGFWLLVVMAGLVMLAAGWLGLEPLIERLQAWSRGTADASVIDRLRAWRDTGRLACLFPLWGSGLGSFEHVFPVVQTAPLTQRWTHAHQDGLQWLAEVGLVGALAGLCLAIAWARGVWRGWPVIGGRRSRFLCGLGAGLVTVAIHSAGDFGLHKPANAFLFSIIAGLMSALTPALPALPGGGDASRGAVAPAASRRYRLAHALLLAAILAVAWMLHLTARAWRAECAHARLQAHFTMLADLRERRQINDALGEILADMPLVLDEATGNGIAMLEISAAWMDRDLLRRVDPALRGRLGLEALQAAVLAAAALPADYLAWLNLARAHAAVGLWDETDPCLDRARNLVRQPRAVRLFAP